MEGFDANAQQFDQAHELVEVIYDTFPITTTKAIYGGSLFEGLRHYTLELDKYEGLCGLDRRSVISYVHGEKVILMCV
jgi:hypothetical protein